MAGARDALRASWGVTDSVYGVSGVVVGIDLRSEGAFITETDLYGRVCAVFMYDGTSTFTVDVQVKAGAKWPTIGGPITVAGYVAYVKDVQQTESNAAYQKLHITAESTVLVDEAVDVTMASI